MKRISLLLFPAIFALGSASFFLGSGVAEAQSDPSGRTRTATPTPVATSAKPAATPPKITEEEGVIKVDTELVNLNVRVIDRNNRPINGLAQSEFKIFEDNVPQQIEFFSRSEVPTNYALVIDNSGSLRSQLEKVIEAGKILVTANKAEDETSIIRFVSRDKITIEQPFTSSKVDLNDALDNLFTEGGQTAIIDAVYLAAEKVAEYEKTRGKDDRKRRALVIVSDGEDRDSYYNEAQLFELLRELDVQIYTIGFVNDLSKEAGFIAKSAQGKAKAFLQRMATETGGKAYFPLDAGELSGVAKEIGAELRMQYSIGYLPSNEKRDGTFRNIKVVLDDGPNKQKRIAITKAGRLAEGDAPAAQTVTQTKPK